MSPLRHLITFSRSLLPVLHSRQFILNPSATKTSIRSKQHPNQDPHSIQSYTMSLTLFLTILATLSLANCQGDTPFCLVCIPNPFNHHRQANAIPANLPHRSSDDSLRRVCPLGPDSLPGQSLSQSTSHSELDRQPGRLHLPQSRVLVPTIVRTEREFRKRVFCRHPASQWILHQQPLWLQELRRSRRLPHSCQQGVQGHGLLW